MDRLEMTILRNLLSDEEYTRRVLPFLKPEYFHDRTERILFEHVQSYFEKYNAIPTTEALNIEVAGHSEHTEDDVSNIKGVLSGFDADTYERPNAEWLDEQTEEWCQDKAVYNGVMESIKILEGVGDLDKGAIPQILSDALGVNFDTHIGHDYIEDADERYEFYHKKESHFPCDLEYFNKITDGGIVRKTLNIIMGGPGSGKTLVMCHLACAYLLEAFDVLYITLEMAEERISERIDANLLDVTIKDLRELPKEVFDKKMERVKSKVVGKLIVKEFPTASAGANHFRHLLNELKLKKNFVPDILIVDYINICTSSRIKPGTNSNSYTIIKSIAEELRGLAVEKNIALLSATQVNRSGFNNSDMGMEDVAESFGLPATADLFLALITSDEMDGLNQIMVKQLKNRYNDPTQDRRFIVGIDRSKMRLYDVEQAAQEDLSGDSSVPFDRSKFGRGMEAERSAKINFD